MIKKILAMYEDLDDSLQEIREVVMEHRTWGGREYEQALRKYDELAIRCDQMKRVIELLQN